MKIVTYQGPEVLIGGLGHSGTSFVWNLFAMMGADVGQDIRGHVGIRKGGEWAPLQRICSDLAKRLGEGTLPDVLPLWERLDGADEVQAMLDEFRPRFRGLTCPGVIKNPESGHWRFLDVINPGYVVICARDLDQWVESMIYGQGHARHADRPAFRLAGRLQQQHIEDEVRRLEIPYVQAPFPRVVEDPEEAWRLLAEPLLKAGAVSVADSEASRFYRAHAKLARPEWVGMTERDRPLER